MLDNDVTLTLRLLATQLGIAVHGQDIPALVEYICSELAFRLRQPGQSTTIPSTPSCFGSRVGSVRRRTAINRTIRREPNEQPDCIIVSSDDEYKAEDRRPLLPVCAVCDVNSGSDTCDVNSGSDTCDTNSDSDVGDVNDAGETSDDDGASCVQEFGQRDEFSVSY